MDRNVDKSLLETFEKTIKLVTSEYPEIRNIWASLRSQILGPDKEQVNEVKAEIKEKP